MANVTATARVDLLNPLNFTGQTSLQSSSQIVITAGGRTDVYTGYGFVYDWWTGSITGGTLTSYTQYAGNAQVLKIDALSLPMTTVANFGRTGDMAGLYREFLKNDDHIFASSASDVLIGGNGNDYIYGGGGNDFIYAGDGNDTIVLGRGSSFVDGGNGVDFLSLPGKAVGYFKAATTEGWQFWNNNEGVNVNTASVERVQFADGVLAFDTAGNAGQAFRLYQAAFNRPGDAEGLGYWIKQMDKGVSLAAIADSFIHAPEFATRYGGPLNTVSNHDFVELLYVNTLGRVSDASGLNYWVNKLATNQTNRGDLLAFFSESQENKHNVDPHIHDGIWYV